MKEKLKKINEQFSFSITILTTTTINQLQINIKSGLSKAKINSKNLYDKNMETVNRNRLRVGEMLEA